MAVTLTDAAAREIRRIMAEQRLTEATRLRVTVAGGGCSGFQYRIDFDKTTNQLEDLTGESHGVPVVIDRTSAPYLDGTEIDFNEDLLNRGFVFRNPQATKTCGCGTSFQV
ncbi:MAG: HesB/IscA family protein [Planctomycetota bacterium]|jgi:iron-sulfur cluster assembly protein